MASLFKKTRTVADRTTGKKHRRKSAKWWGRYRDAQGIVRRVPLATDKAAAQALQMRPNDRRVPELWDGRTAPRIVDVLVRWSADKKKGGL